MWKDINFQKTYCKLLADYATKMLFKIWVGT